MPVSQGDRMPKRSRSQKEMTHAEIQALLLKLKEIVPNMPRNRKLSKLEIIQNVIDYIVDLQIALESHPVPNHGVNLRINSPVPRQPLGVIPSESNSPACGSREVRIFTQSITIWVQNSGLMKNNIVGLIEKLPKSFIDVLRNQWFSLVEPMKCVLITLFNNVYNIYTLTLSFNTQIISITLLKHIKTND